MLDNTPVPTTAGPEPDQSPDFDTLAVLAGLSGVTAEDMTLLKILTDPALNDRQASTHMEMADLFEEEFSGYTGGDTNYEAEQVADLLYNYYAAKDDLPDFGFGFDTTSGGEIGGFTVTATITGKTTDGFTDYANQVVLSVYSDLKNVTADRSASGFKAALGYAVALNDAYVGLCALARKRGLLPAAPPVLDRAVAALAAYDAAVAHDDVDVDTLADLRDSLIGLLTAQGHQPTT